MTPDAVKPAPKTETAKPTKKSVAKKEVNKSAEIRKVASGMKAKGEKPRPKTIMETLKKQGITVSSPQVSMVLKKMGFRPRKRRNIAQATPPSATLKKGTKVKVEDLVKAKRLATQMGGVDKALASLQALKDFEG